jgi:hypothetical protein
LPQGFNEAGAFLFATNFDAGTVDVFDSESQPVSTQGGFADPQIPAGYAASRRQNAAHARHVVARIEQVPAPACPGFEPRREVAHAKRMWHSDIAQVVD